MNTGEIKWQKRFDNILQWQSNSTALLFQQYRKKNSKKKKSPAECLDIFLDYFINPPSFISSLMV